MEEMALKYADQAHFLFIYIREAHPGELIPHHTSYQEKVSHASAFRQRGLQRTILIDSLDGQVHRLYGGLPNMTWIIDHTGHVAYRASWTEATDIEAALEDTLKLRELRRTGSSLPVYREMIANRRHIRASSDDSRYLGGKKAAEDARRYFDKVSRQRG